MARHSQIRPIDDAVELLRVNGFDGLAEAVTVLLNSAMRAERSEYLGAVPYERTVHRRGYANGCKDKQFKNRLGTLPLIVPQTRDGQFYPQSLEKGLRPERAAAEPDAMLEAWRSRNLGCYCYIVLGCSVSLSEAEVHWRAFLSGLKDRGLYGLHLIVSDAHEGLRAARQAVFPSVPWQRCQFHLQQNAGHYVPQVSMRAPVAADIRAIFNAPDRDEAEHLLDKFLRRYEQTAPALVRWAEEALPEGFTVFALPPSHRRRLRTTNLVERLNEEIRRRTRVARLFPNEAACLRLVSAILMEISEDWQTAERRYVVFTERDAIEG